MTSRDPIDLLAAALTPTIALLGIYIAWRQHRLQREKLRLALYERRFKVYRALMDFLGAVIRDAVVSVEGHRRFRIETAEAEFLFEKEVAAYLADVSKRALRFRELNERLRANAMPMGVDRTTVVEEESAELTWLSAQVEAGAGIFSPYLSFSKL